METKPDENNSTNTNYEIYQFDCSAIMIDFPLDASGQPYQPHPDDPRHGDYTEYEITVHWAASKLPFDPAPKTIPRHTQMGVSMVFSSFDLRFANGHAPDDALWNTIKDRARQTAYSTLSEATLTALSHFFFNNNDLNRSLIQTMAAGVAR